eukprot:gnl/MRDRNA2_/MRDRNA2_101456_c0_seq1.p1 gnl/MRDRNA2_/MRDRNA2_101456_c0~~gnl/MRDRNA2_/MRDRNA2_101456_c0_seq1.p1  ORF type:complete len:697 (-),score=117.38 gnl/MRDRNA2_/MRDRNA2_101456_c0_seq1:195-2000(-)
MGAVLYEGNQDIGGNVKEAWYDHNEDLQRRAKTGPHGIPMLIGSDSVHGHSHVRDTTIFPHNIALGCSQNKTLVKEVARVSAIESAATGVNFMFAPCLDVVNDIRWGRTYESFGQDPQLVNELGGAFIEGANGAGTGMITSAKHFVGAGGTDYGTGRLEIPQTRTVEMMQNLKPLSDVQRRKLTDSGSLTKVRMPLDRGDAQLTHSALFTKHMVPYWGAVRAGTHAVMASYSSVNGVLNHQNKELLQYLKGGTFGGMNFQGFVVSDYGGVDMIDPNFDIALPEAVNAGIDMVMLPGTKNGCRPWSSSDRCPTAQSFVTDIIKHVQSGKISMSRIDDAVSRIIKAKLDSGVYNSPMPDSSWLDSIGSAAHRSIAREAVQQSVVLLQNRGDALPLRKDERVCVAGRAGNDLGYQLGGWSVKWQGEDPDSPEKEINHFTTGTTIWGDVQKRLPNSHYDRSGICEGYDTIIAVVGEPPYAEAYGDRKDLSLQHTDKLMLKNAHAVVNTESGKAKRKIIMVMMTGRPLWIDDMLPHVDAAIASFLPGSEGGTGIMDVLTGAFAPTGKLGVIWPKSTATLPVTEESDASQVLYPLGHGLTFKKNTDL